MNEMEVKRIIEKYNAPAELNRMKELIAEQEKTNKIKKAMNNFFIAYLDFLNAGGKIIISGGGDRPLGRFEADITVRDDRTAIICERPEEDY